MSPQNTFFMEKKNQNYPLINTQIDKQQHCDQFSLPKAR